MAAMPPPPMPLSVINKDHDKINLSCSLSRFDGVATVVSPFGCVGVLLVVPGSVHGSVQDVVFVVLGVVSVDFVVPGVVSWCEVAGVVLGLLVVCGTRHIKLKK